jgi:hypothetical protein
MGIFRCVMVYPSFVISKYLLCAYWKVHDVAKQSCLSTQIIPFSLFQLRLGIAFIVHTSLAVNGLYQ